MSVIWSSSRSLTVAWAVSRPFNSQVGLATEAMAVRQNVQVQTEGERWAKWVIVPCSEKGRDTLYARCAAPCPAS